MMYAQADSSGCYQSNLEQRILSTHIRVSSNWGYDFGSPENIRLQIFWGSRLGSPILGNYHIGDTNPNHVFSSTDRNPTWFYIDALDPLSSKTTSRPLRPHTTDAASSIQVLRDLVWHYCHPCRTGS